MCVVVQHTKNQKHSVRLREAHWFPQSHTSIVRIASLKSINSDKTNVKVLSVLQYTYSFTLALSMRNLQIMYLYGFPSLSTNSIVPYIPPSISIRRIEACV